MHSRSRRVRFKCFRSSAPHNVPADQLQARVDGVDDGERCGSAHRGMVIRIEIKLRPTRRSNIQRRCVSDGRSTRGDIQERGILVMARDVRRPPASAWAWAGEGGVPASLVYIGSAERCDAVAIVGIGIVPRRDDSVQDVGGGLDAQGLEEKKGEYDQRT